MENKSDTYQLPPKWKKRIIWASVCFFLIGIFPKFSIKESLKATIVEQLQSGVNCPISYRDLDVSLFLPSVSMKQLLVSGQCFNLPAINLKLDDIKISSSLLGLFPPSLKFSISLGGMGSKIDLFSRIGWGWMDVQLSDGFVTGKFISSLTEYPRLFDGELYINGVVALQANRIENAKLKIDGKKLLMPSQEIKFGFIPFNVPDLNFKNLKLLSEYQQNSLAVKEFSLGGEKEVVHLEANGSIAVNLKNINRSNLDLQGRFRLQKKILDELSAIKLFLPKNPPQDDYYRLKLSGKLGRPKPKFL